MNSCIRLAWIQDDRQERHFNFMLDPLIVRALAPLPRGREIDGFAAVEAVEQLQRRREAAKHLGGLLASAVLEMAELDDPENGYDKAHEGYSEFKRNLRR